MKKYFIVLLSFVMFFTIFTVTANNVLADNKEQTVCDGVYVNDIHLGGKTKQEAEQMLGQYIQDIENKEIELTTEKGSLTTTMKDLGFKCEPYDYIEKALEVGKSGNLIKRYKELKDIEHNSLVYNLEFSIEKANIQQLVEMIATEYDMPSKNASISRANGQFIITNHEIGRKLLVDESVEKVYTAVTEKIDDTKLSVGLVTMEDIPLYTTETFQKVKDVLGTFTTTYETSSSSRATNLSNGSKLINGTVLLPGEVLSCYELLNPFTEENGYMTAGAYQNGVVIDSVGGGVCQVSSTLYNAVLFAELEIVERFPHSMTVSYVGLSRDAAIAGTYKDFKFRNNTQAPLYIETYTVGKSITFNIYGEETRSKTRTLSFISEEIETTPPPEDVVTKDPTLPDGQRKVTQAAHYGHKAKCFKVVYDNGVEVERIQINSSNYSASPAYVTLGTKKAETTTEATTENTDTATDKPSNDGKNNDTAKNNNDNKKDQTTQPTTEQVTEPEDNEYDIIEGEPVIDGDEIQE